MQRRTFVVASAAAGAVTLMGSRAAAAVLKAKAIAEGMVPMRDYGWAKVINGETTIDEVIAVTAGGG